jgi:hypothetical protein
VWSLNPAVCLIPSQELRYWNDDSERAELWENTEMGPSFGEEVYYGFSMWVDAASAPYGDYNRVSSDNGRLSGTIRRSWHND